MAGSSRAFKRREMITSPIRIDISLHKEAKMNYNYNFIIHLLLNKYGWTQEEIGAWTWKKTNGS